MIDAIVYTSNTGHTAQYAALLGEKTGLPVYSLREAGEKLGAGAEIIYLGWLMASVVKGYRDAGRRYRVRAVCGVGMGGAGTQLNEVRKANKLDEQMPVFTLQGGFDMKKLRGAYKFMMQIMAKTTGRALAGKKDRTPDEDAMLDMLLHGGSFVSGAQLAGITDWYHSLP